MRFIFYHEYPIPMETGLPPLI
ncbi:hypothetical protein FNP_1914 [Fusobacterium polymorphum ATCC 10953]|uniref:Uncharacterized protein n=1 Tax=Fusobacterium polymorphum ATCC 10953 TaxID=393480 RepID=A5TXR0_FUSNP|nr:hypothetical protein FNP_1914 [Fusobacterium polymorphum ATCC 10953]